MSTRTNIRFCYGDEVVANIYRHSDGYPEGVLPDLQTFFTAVEEQCPNDTRFNDPEYLAAKFVVWQSQQYGKDLDFLSVGICVKDHGDIDYVYDIDCKGVRGVRPKVRWKKPNETAWREGMPPKEGEACSHCGRTS